LTKNRRKAFITRLRDLCEAVLGVSGAGDSRGCRAGASAAASRSPPPATSGFAAHDARFGMPGKCGSAIPSVIHAALLPRLIGWGRARWLVMTAENIDAPTALAWGLVAYGRSARRSRCRGRARGQRAARMRPASAAGAKGAAAAMGRTAVEGIGRSEHRVVFGQSFLTDEPKHLMQGFIDRKR